MPQMDEHEQTRLTLAVLIACQVRALAASNPGLVEAYSDELGKAHRTIKGWEHVPNGVLEALHWADEQARSPR